MKMFRFNPPFKGFHIVSKLMVILFTFNTAYAVTIFPFIFYRNRYGKSNLITYNSHLIYLHQQMECYLVGTGLYVGIGLLFHVWLWTLSVVFLYFWWYLIEYFVNIIKYKGNFNKKMISFEREAYNNSNIYGYYLLRRPFNWIKYII
jgi:hypothetical protein